MKISELRPFAKKVELTVKALSKNEIREVTSKLDNSTHKVTEVMVGDDSGTVLLTLWDDAIEKVEPGKSYKIANAFTSLFKNTLRLNLGRYGELSEAEEEVEVNEQNNMSEKELEVRRRPFNRGGFNRGPRGGMRDNYHNRSEGNESDENE
jgi:replication factor A1